MKVLLLLRLGNLVTTLWEGAMKIAPTYLGWFIFGFLGCLIIKWAAPYNAFKGVNGNTQIIIGIILSVIAGPLILLTAFCMLIISKVLKNVWNS